MRPRAVVLAVVVVVTGGVCQAWEFRIPDIEVGVDYVSRYMWRGFDSYGNNHSAVQPWVDFSCPDSGWSANIWLSRANGSRFENYEEINHTLAYANSWWAGAWCATDYQFAYVYYNYPDGPVRDSCHNLDLDAHEMSATFSWPNVCSHGVVPSYTAMRLWEAESGRRSSDGCPWSEFRGSGGWIHVFGLAYDQAIPGWFVNNPDQTLHWTAQAVFNDHAGGAGDHDWSHAVFGVSTDLPTFAGGTLTPGFWWQSSWDDSVNTSDEWWVGLSGAWPVN